jgi:hypothetical protein
VPLIFIHWHYRRGTYVRAHYRRSPVNTCVAGQLALSPTARSDGAATVRRSPTRATARVRPPTPASDDPLLAITPRLPFADTAPSSA